MRITTRAVACACLLLAAGIALAAGAGDLDTTFGQGGVIVSDLGLGESPYAVALQSDGKIVVGGPARDASVGQDVWFLARYDASGNLDTGYGQGGLVLPFPANADWSQPLWDLVLDADDRAVATGYAVIGTEVVTGKGKKQTVETVFEWQCAVVRVDANGALDETFGDGGIAIVHTGLDLPRGMGVLIQPDGKIVVSGGGHQPQSRKGRGGGIDNDIGFVARLDTNGDPDQTFGDGGLTLTDQVDGVDVGFPTLRCLARQSDGALLVSGRVDGPWTDHRFFLRRYDADGILDTGFDSVALVVDDIRDLAVDDLDRIYAAGNNLGITADSGYVARYDPDGTPDAGFGDGGIATLVGDGNGGAVDQIVLDAAERVYAFGGPFGSVDRLDITYLARLDEDGQPDASFGTLGYAASLPLAIDHVAGCLALDADGNIIVSGWTRIEGVSSSNRNLYIARYLANTQGN